MLARQIQTRYWDDEFIAQATWQSRYVFMYLLTCPNINMIGIFQISDKKIGFETGLEDEDIRIAKEELSEYKKVLFYDGWVCVVNAFKNCKVWKSPMCWRAWEEEWSKVRKAARDYFNSAINSDIYSTQKKEIETQKEEYRKRQEEKINKNSISLKEEVDQLNRGNNGQVE